MFSVSHYFEHCYYVFLSSSCIYTTTHIHIRQDRQIQTSRRTEN